MPPGYLFQIIRVALQFFDFLSQCLVLFFQGDIFCLGSREILLDMIVFKDTFIVKHYPAGSDQNKDEAE